MQDIEIEESNECENDDSEEREEEWEKRGCTFSEYKEFVSR